MLRIYKHKSITKVVISITFPIKRTSRVGIVLDNEDDDTKVKYCENCLKLNRTSVLKQRVYLDDKGKALPAPPDAEDWLQCWTCGLIVSALEYKTENKK